MLPFLFSLKNYTWIPLQIQVFCGFGTPILFHLYSLHLGLYYFLYQTKKTNSLKAVVTSIICAYSLHSKYRKKRVGTKSCWIKIAFLKYKRKRNLTNSELVSQATQPNKRSKTITKKGGGAWQEVENFL